MGNDKGFTLIELLIVVTIIGIIAAIAIPSLLNALERAKQTTTVDRIQALGGYIEQYIMDHNDVGCPKVDDDIEALQNIFVQTEINFNAITAKDGWGELVKIDLESAIGGRAYTLTSYGSDLAPGPDPETPGIVRHFTEDIIWTKGTFLQRPEGLQTSQ